jgi:NAD+ synthase
MSSQITERSMKSAYSNRGRCPNRSNGAASRLGVPICEDIWQDRVCAHLAEAGADFLLVPNGSPFEIDKDDKRQTLVRSRVVSTGLALAYLNRIGGQDELAFDGSSFIINADGERVVQLCDWQEQLLLTEWETSDGRWGCVTREACTLDAFPQDIYHAMMIALRDYVASNGFPGIILGLSGGIDSALSAAVAVDTLGASKVWGVMLPSKYTSGESLEDAQENARLLGCRHDVISIAPAVDAVSSHAPRHQWAGRRKRPGAAAYGDAHGSVQFGRADAAHHRQQERDVRRLCDPLRRHGGRLFGPQGRLQDNGFRPVALAQRQQARGRRGTGRAGDAAADHRQTAERRTPTRPERRGQPAALSLLDRILEAWSSRNCRCSEVAEATGADETLVAEIEKKLLRAEYKRRQAPPGVKLGSRNFGRDRRYPITNAFHTGR